MNKFYVALLLVFVADVLYAQSPGGVSTNLSVWLKADNTSTLSPNTGSLNTWTYSNNPGNSYSAAAGQQPTVTANVFNFLPAINFNGTQFMTGPSGLSAPIPAGQPNYSVFAVWSSTVTGNARIWVQRPASSGYDQAGDGAALWIYPAGGGYGDQPEIGPAFTYGVFAAPAYNTPILNYSTGTPYISEMNLLNAATNDLELMDQTNYATGPGVTTTSPAGATATRNLTDAANLLGARSASIDEPFIGNLAELIIYSGNVTPAQRSAIFSYLSIKYGIPLGGDYVSSAGTALWESGLNGSWEFNNYDYNHFVFGIGMDNASGLTNAKSNSLSTAGVSGQGNILIQNPSSLSDQGFMVIGSNNQGFAETGSNLPTTSPIGAKRLANQWLVQNSGTVGTVDLSFDFTGIPTTGTIGTSSDFALLVDHDGDGDFTTGSPSVIAPSSWNGNVVTFSGVTLNSNKREVIAILSNSNGTPLPVNWVSFAAKANGPNVDLNWTVSANENANVYDVQRSENGTSFSSVGQVANQTGVQSYGFVDANAGPGTHYYRVLETDRDGKSIYSKIVSVDMSASDFGVRLLNNPVISNGPAAELEITAGKAGNAALEIWALGGSRVATMMQGIPAGTSRIQLPTSNLAPGTYAVKIRVNDVTQTVQIVKL